MVSRIFSAPPSAVNVPVYPMSTDMAGTSSSESIPFHAGHTPTGPMLYSPAMPPSSSYQTDHVPKPPQYPSNSPHLVTPGALTATSHAPSGIPGGGGGPSHIRRPSTSAETLSPTAVRQSPLSLASITSPYNTDTQSKNYHAQTLNLPGVRLRPALQLLRDGWNGLATTITATMALRHDTWARRWENTHYTHTRHTRQRRARMLPSKDRRHLPAALPWLSTYPALRLVRDMENRAA